MGGALVGFVDGIQPARTAAGQPIAVLALTLNKSIEPLPVDSTFDGPAEGLDRAEVPPGQTGSIATQASPTAPPCRDRQTSAEVDLDQVLSMFDPPTRAGRHRLHRSASATALAGRGGDLNDAIGAFVPLVTDLGRWRATWPRSKTDLGGLLPRARVVLAARVAPVAQHAGEPVREPRHARSRALAGVSRPVPAGLDLPDAAHVRGRDRRHADDPAVPDRHGGAVQRAAARVRDAADERAGAGRRVRRRRAQPARHGGARPASWSASPSTCSSYGQNPAVQQGLDRLTLTATSLHPPLRFLTPVQSSCNYVTLFLRNISACCPRTPSSRDHAALHAGGDRRRAGRRGGPVADARTRTPATDPQRRARTGARQPVPEHRLAGPDAECAAGNEPYSGAAAADRQPAGQLGLKTESTTRQPRRRQDREQEVRRHQPTRLELRRRAHRRGGDRRRRSTSCSAARRRSPASRSCSRRCSRSRPSCTSPRRCGSPASTSARSSRCARLGRRPRRPRWSRWTSTRTACPIHADATARDPVPDLPRGQLLRRPASRARRTRPRCLRARRCRPANTSGPVQLDRVLAALTSNAAAQPADAAAGLRRRAEHPPTAAQDATQDPSVRGLTGGQALNQSLKYSAGAFRASAIVNQALLGHPAARPLRRGAGQRGGVPGARRQRQNQLASLVDHVQPDDGRARLPPAGPEPDDRAAAAAAAHRRTARSTSLDASFGPTRAFARAILPGHRAARPDDRRRRSRGCAQATALVSQSELGRLLVGPHARRPEDRERAPVDTKLARRAGRQLARCFTHNLVPTGNEVIQDPPAEQRRRRSTRSCSRARWDSPAPRRTSTATAATSARRRPAAATPRCRPATSGPRGRCSATPCSSRWARARPGRAQAPPVKRSRPCFQNAAPNLNRASTGGGP